MIIADTVTSYLCIYVGSLVCVPVRLGVRLFLYISLSVCLLVFVVVSLLPTRQRFRLPTRLSSPPPSRRHSLL